ncbi:MAG: hypothetical protein NTX61_16745 [Bacteroidetes bacterium]|nr:hypothetical protein [Bacteroidota bacterium]
MSNYQIRPIDSSSNTTMLEILRGAPIITDRMTICFDRQPDIFALARCKYDDFYYQGLFRGETLKGFGMVGYHKAYVNGEPSEVFCGRDLYVLPEARGIGFVFKSTENHFREHQNRSKIGYGLIMQGNNASLKYIGKRFENYKYIPLSRIINQLLTYTILLTVPVHRIRSFTIRRAQTEDIPVIVGFLNNEHRNRLFGHIYSEASFPAYLERNKGLLISDYFLAFDRIGKCCGVCAAWDMNLMKQTRILHYGRSFLPALVAYKTLSAIFNRPSLPRPGDHFREVTLTDYAVKGRDPGIMNALLRTIYHEYRQLGYHFLTWGSSIDDPILTASKGFIRQSVISNIVLFSTNDSWIREGMIKNNLPYIDVSGI